MLPPSSRLRTIVPHHTCGILDFTKDDSTVDWYFLGDVHGDLSCLTWTFDYLRHLPDFRLCFLGDLFDRGPDEKRCIDLFVEFAIEHSGKVVWIAGNHDVPGNHGMSNPAMSGFEDWLITLPVAAWFPNGIVATHGGWTKQAFPSPPIPANQLTPEQRRTLQTTRLAQFPNEANEELDNLPTFSPQDLAYSASKGFPPIRLLIRGHDHPMEGYCFLQEPKQPGILTLLGSTQLGIQFYPKLHRRWTTLAKVSQSGIIDLLRIDSTGNGEVIERLSWRGK